MLIFAAEARKLVTDPDITDTQRATLDYLLRHCVGSRNARTIDTVVTHLNEKGFDIDIRKFQHHVLGWSRECNVYIASGRNGIYLIKDQADAELMMSFYRDRINAEQHRLQRLSELVDKKWPQNK